MRERVRIDVDVVYYCRSDEEDALDPGWYLEGVSGVCLAGPYESRAHAVQQMRHVKGGVVFDGQRDEATD